MKAPDWPDRPGLAGWEGAEVSVLFKTARLDVRRWTLDDALAALHIYSDPEVMRHIGGETTPDLPAQRAQITKFIEAYEGQGPEYGRWPLIVRDTGALIGAVLMKPLPGVDNQPTQHIEIGWHLGRAHWGRGYASEAARALIEHALETTELQTLHAVVDPPNTASLRLAERLGMEPMGLTRLYYGGRELELFRLDRRAGLHAPPPTGLAPSA